LRNSARGVNREAAGPMGGRRPTDGGRREAKLAKMAGKEIPAPPTDDTNRVASGEGAGSSPKRSLSDDCYLERTARDINREA
jgi:hypothetical protein